MSRISDAVSSGLKVGQEIRGIHNQRVYDEELATIKSPAQLAQERGEQEPNLNDQISYLRQRVELAGKYGKADPDTFMQADSFVRKAKGEGFVDALKHFHSGDLQGGASLYNSTGNHRVQVVGAKDVEETIGGVPVKGKLVHFRDESGQESTINTARALADLGSLDGILKREQEGYKLGSERIKANADRTKADAESKGAGKSGYKVEVPDVTSIFGTPAVDKKGRPIMDTMTGRQVVNRNIEAEQAFLDWMDKNGITNTDEGLAKYPGLRPQSKGITAPRKVPQKSLDEF